MNQEPDVNKEAVQKEGNDMSVMEKPTNIAFEIEPDRRESFLSKDTKPDFIKAMQKLEEIMAKREQKEN